MEVLRTPDTCFENLPGYPFAPHYTNVPDGEGGGAFTAQASQFISSVPNPCLAKPLDRDTLLAALETASTPD